MAKLSIGIGSISRSEYIYLLDITSTSGAGKTGIVYNTSGLSGHYVRSAGSATSILFVPQTANGAWASGGFAEVDSTLMPGIYRIDLPDAVFSSGSDKAIVMIRGASNTVPVTLEYQLVGSDPSLVLSNASIANTTWTNASRTITGGIADTVTTLTDRTKFSVIAGIITSVSNPVDITTSSMSGIANTAWTNSSRTITGGIADTVTNLTNKAGFAITGGTITTNSDKTGYSLSQSFPANFSSLSITGGKVSVVKTDLDYVINNIPQVNYSNIAAANWNYLLSGIAITGSIGYIIKANLDTTVSSRSTLTSNQVLQSVQNSTKSTTTVSQEIFSKLPL